MEQRHIPVMLAETLHYLAPARGGVFVDCTVGLGGHAAALLDASSDVTLIGIDRDPRALALAAERLAPWADRVTLLEGTFGTVARLLADRDITRIDGLLADLGVSSLQMDEAERGFAFSHDGPLDMRMGTTGDGPDAAEIVNVYPEDALTTIFREYGEERQARRIARAIVDERGEKPFETTGDLRSLVERTKSVRPGARRRRIHPATQVFQALRIEVNRELDELGSLMKTAGDLLNKDARLVAISYHSLEDRIVKNTLRDLATGEIDRVTGRPRAETQIIEVLTRKPIRPSEEEVVRNPRSRSGRLRAGRRL